jgi:CPA1 family monovalent cation:H+ antiporter
MLGFLLFAGALTIDLNELSKQRGLTAALVIPATVGSMFIIGALAWLIFRATGIAMDWTSCLLFGALISPTDPVAVLSVMNRAGAPAGVRTVIAGESLFNDGVGVVLFLTLLNLTQNHSSITFVGVSRLFIQQALGGAALGLLLGILVYRLLKSVHEFEGNILLTLALAMGGYALAQALDVSGPIAVVVAGLLIGNQGRVFHMQRESAADLMRFWALVDEILNAVLFVMVGLEVLAMPFSIRYLIAAAGAIPAVLLARWLTVVATVRTMHLRRWDGAGLEAVLTWGGLRGGLAIAMALSLPPGGPHDRIVAVTYIVVAFSILVQGTTIRRVVHRAFKGNSSH